MKKQEKQGVASALPLDGTEYLTAPNLDEIEVSVFGPGYGECIVVHIGNGEWLIVDSCQRPKSREPYAKEYLDRLKVSPTKVRLIIASHWHDDHCKGLAKLVDYYPTAVFCAAHALSAKEFSQLLEAYNSSPSAAVGSKVRELHRVFRMFANGSVRPPPRRASQGTALLTVGPTVVPAVEVIALSPSDFANNEFVRRMAAQFPTTAQTKKCFPSPEPNDIALAVVVRIGDFEILLGSDLERDANPQIGWTAVLNATNIKPFKAGIVKVAHHGSETGDEPEIWKQRIEPGAWALLTPFNRGKKKLPSPSDIQRTLSRTPEAYLAAPIKLSSLKIVDPVVRKVVNEMNAKLSVINRQFGAVRLRSNDSQNNYAEWHCWCFGDALALK